MKNIFVILWCLASFLVSSTVQDIDAEIAPESIVGIWLFEEGGGDTLMDTSGNENDGKIIGAKWTEGKIGNGLEFDGVSLVKIPASDSTENYLDGFTYLLSVKPTLIPAGSHIRLIERGWHNPTIQIGHLDFYCSIVVDGKQDFSHIRGGAWKLDEWSSVATTYDGDVLKLYVDGELVGEKKLGEPDKTLNAEIRLAAFSRAGWDFIGVIDEVGVFNAPLSDNDIKRINNFGLEEALDVSAIDKLASTWAQIKLGK